MKWCPADGEKICLNLPVHQLGGAQQGNAGRELKDLSFRRNFITAFHSHWGYPGFPLCSWMVMENPHGKFGI